MLSGKELIMLPTEFQKYANFRFNLSLPLKTMFLTGSLDFICFLSIRSLACAYFRSNCYTFITKWYLTLLIMYTLCNLGHLGINFASINVKINNNWFGCSYDCMRVFPANLSCVIKTFQRVEARKGSISWNRLESGIGLL